MLRKIATGLFQNQLPRLVTFALLLATFATGSSAEPASAVSAGVCWAWNMENKVTGIFLTNGSYNGTSADAGTYALSDFKVNTSIYPSVEVGSVADGTYAFGSQPPYSFIWNGSAPTTFQRNGYTNGFGIQNGSGVPDGAYIGFDINWSRVSDSVYGTSRFSSTNTITLSPTTRSACDATPPLAAPAFTLSPPSGNATTGSVITSYTIDASAGGTVESYSISPAIINGTLSFSTSTGLLSGTPSTAASATAYTITAHNATAPDATRTYSLTIHAPAPVDVYIPPTPVPYLKALTPPRMQMEPTQLLCFAGTYNFGYTLDGVIQGSSTSYYKPPYPYTYKLIINGVPQSLQPKPGFQGTGVWDIARVPSGSIASCSVTVSVNTVTNTSMSTELNDENKSKLSAASLDLNQSIKDANTLYTEMLLIYSNAYKDTLSSNRKTWRTNVEDFRASYNNELARINSLGANWPNYTRLLKSEALKKYITELKKNAADYRASGPAALAAKNHGNQLALNQKNAWIAAANSSYGTFIESIGYGVLIP